MTPGKIQTPTKRCSQHIKWYITLGDNIYNKVLKKVCSVTQSEIRNRSVHAKVKERGVIEPDSDVTKKGIQVQSRFFFISCFFFRLTFFYLFFSSTTTLSPPPPLFISTLFYWLCLSREVSLKQIPLLASLYLLLEM